jgi:sirohydrochlorin ferrochelatase
MATESILLVGRDDGNTREVLGTHADRLEARADAEAVVVATYEREPVRELRETVEGLTAETVYVVPMCAAHTYDTVNEIPAVLSYCPGEVRYCEPVGGSPVVTDILEQRAEHLVPGGPDTSLVLVGFGSSSQPYNRQTTDYHATRLREQSAYGEVVNCYLLQNPTVECVRYNVSGSRAVAVPLFVASSEATEERIPSELELGRGGIEYADPLGDHPQVTEAILAEVEKQRSLADDAAPTFEASLTDSQRPLATDGEGL